ncbi:MAG: subtilisin-like serine protease [Bacteroidetes bacterium]|nr:MAG: subtilisin-like serine protease [Bacteroidota bacterium]
MKAILMNTADDLGNPGPDFIFGYGRINGRKAILPIEQNTFAVDSVQNSTVNMHTITVPAGTGRLKVLVYWHDYPAAVNASVALVNNLDIAVTDPSSAVFNPWILDFTPNSSNLNANAVRGIDMRNNHEQVTIDNPAAGNYTVSVSGTAVPQGPQKYFLAWYFEPATELVMIYPNGSEGFVPAETETIRWDAFGNSGNFSLDYSTDGGSSWSTITSGVSATQRYYNWTVPVALSGMCKVRVTRGADNDVSDANFSIIDVPANISVQWACPDSLMLTWNAVGGATAYDIFMLGNTYMDSIGTTVADSFVVYNLNNLTNTYWFSVRAKGAQNAIGRRAIAIEKLPGAACPVQVDAAVSVVNSPGGNFNSCMSTSALQVSIGLDNPGLTAITNIPVYYSLNNGTPVSETYIGTIQPFGSATYTFTATVNVSTPGINTIKAWAVYPSDGNVVNDTSSAIVNISTFPAVTPPWTEDFESFALCGTTSNCDSTVCGMINGLTNLANNEQDDIDWRTSEGSTPSTQTGPGTDFLPGSTTGNYLYLEASGGCDGKTALLYTPCIDLVNFPAAVLSFAYHMYGGNMGDLYVDVYSGGSWTNGIFSMTGDQGNQWTQVQVPLSTYAGQIITLRFRGVTGNGYASDMAIDAISITDPSAVAEQNSTATFSVYPNPGNGIYNLQVSGLNKSAVMANVFDVTGRKIRSSGFGIVSGTLQTAIDLSVFENGLYYLELTAGETKTTIKLEKVD